MSLTSKAAFTWTLLVIGTVFPCKGQTLTHAPERVTWPLVDFVVFGDSSHGVQFLASPNLQSEQGREHIAALTLTLEPLATRRWAVAVALLVDSVSRLRPQDRTPFVTVPLRANLGRARLTISLDGKGPPATPFSLAIFDSVSQNGWSAYSSAADIRDLLTAVDATAQVSAFDSVPPPFDRAATFLSCQLDHGPEPRKALRLRYPPDAQRRGREGRVLAEFIVDSAGTVRSEAFHTLLSDGDDFSDAAREAVLHTAFVPGELRGRPVNTRVWQWFAFRMRH